MSAVHPLPAALPPLQSGDVLTREEFEARYHAMPDLKKAELIEGVVYVPSPVRIDIHGRPHVAVSTWIGVYWTATPGIDTGDNSSVRLDWKNEPQPDLLLYIPRALGGQAEIDEGGYLAGAPELVVEVAATSANYDLNAKMGAYRRNGVQEYLVWRVLDRAFDWFVLRDGQYERLAPGPDGFLRSEVFPGLWLDQAALLSGYQARVMEVLQQGIASEEHQEFVRKLAARAEKA